MGVLRLNVLARFLDTVRKLPQSRIGMRVDHVLILKLVNVIMCCRFQLLLYSGSMIWLRVVSRT